MRKIIVHKKTTLPVDIIWKTFSDIYNYPKTVTFVQSVIIHSSIKKNTKWEDMTTIFWVPMNIPHIITEIQEKKTISYDVTLPFGGFMQQVYVIIPKKEITEIIGTISFHLGNPISNFIIGPILEKRLQYMLLSSFERMEKMNM